MTLVGKNKQEEETGDSEGEGHEDIMDIIACMMRSGTGTLIQMATRGCKE